MHFESTCAPSVALRFPPCIQYVSTKFIYLPFAMDLIRRDHKISGRQPLTLLYFQNGKQQISILMFRK